MEYQIGQKLFVAHNDSRYEYCNCDVYVTKVGRKWITVSKTLGGPEYDQFDRETRHQNGRGYSYRCKLFENQEAHAAEIRANNKWRNFRRTVSGLWSAPDSMTEAHIDELIALVGKHVKKES